MNVNIRIESKEKVKSFSFALSLLPVLEKNFKRRTQCVILSTDADIEAYACQWIDKEAKISSALSDAVFINIRQEELSSQIKKLESLVTLGINTIILDEETLVDGDFYEMFQPILISNEDLISVLTFGILNDIDLQELLVEQTEWIEFSLDETICTMSQQLMGVSGAPLFLPLGGIPYFLLHPNDLEKVFVGFQKLSKADYVNKFGSIGFPFIHWGSIQYKNDIKSEYMKYGAIPIKLI